MEAGYICPKDSLWGTPSNATLTRGFMKEDVQDSPLVPTEIVRGDVRAIPPSLQWQNLLRESPGDVTALKAFARASSERAHLLLGRQDLSWSAESLVVIAGVSDRFLTLVSSSQSSRQESGVVASTFSDELVKVRADRSADRKARRAAYRAGKVGKADEASRG